MPDWPARMGEDMAALYLGVSETTLRGRRGCGRYPRPVSDGKRILYSREQLDRFVRAQFGLPLNEQEGQGMGRLNLPNVCLKAGALLPQEGGGQGLLPSPARNHDPNFAEAYERARPERSARPQGRHDGRAGGRISRQRGVPLDPARPTPARNYERYLDMLVEDHGDKRVRDLSRQDVKRERDKLGRQAGQGE
jgi:hypothetical protein